MEDLAVNFNVRQISATRSLNGADFASGTLDFGWTCGGVNHWQPTKTYCKADAEIEGYGNYQYKTPLVSDMIALADNWVACLFTQCNQQIGDQDIAIINQFLPQASTIKQKLSRSFASRHSIGEVKSDMVSMAKRLYRNAYGAPGDLGDGTTQFITKGVLNANMNTATIGSVAVTGVFTCAVGRFDGTMPVTVPVTSPIINDTLINPGDVLMVGGPTPGGGTTIGYTRYIVKTVDSATNITVEPASTTTIAQTNNFYFIRQNIQSTSINKNVVTGIFVPPVGLYDWAGWMGPGSYKLILTPNANYQKTAVETKSPLWNHPTDGFRLKINDVKLYVWTAKLLPIEGPKTLMLREMEVLQQAYANGTSFQYSVKPSTKSIAIFVQSSLAGSSNIFPPSLFKAYPADISKGRQGELSIRTLSITYASLTKPGETVTNSQWLVTPNGKQVDATNPQTNRLVQRYYDNFNEHGSAGSTSGIVTLDEWLQNPWYYYSFNTDITDRSTEVSLNITYDNLAFESKVFVVAFYNRTINYTTSLGQVVAVAARDV